MSKRYWVHVSDTNEELGPFVTMREADVVASEHSQYGDNNVTFIYRQGESPLYMYADGFKHRVVPDILVDPREGRDSTHYI